MSCFAQHTHGFEPAEYLFDTLTFAHADRIAGVLGGAAVCLAIALCGGGSERRALGQKADVKNPRQQPGTDMGIYSPGMHKLYDGDFHLSGGKVYMVGGLNDKPGWDHIDNEAKTVIL